MSDHDNTRTTEIANGDLNQIVYKEQRSLYRQLQPAYMCTVGYAMDTHKSVQTVDDIPINVGPTGILESHEMIYHRIPPATAVWA